MDARRDERRCRRRPARADKGPSRPRREQPVPGHSLDVREKRDASPRSRAAGGKRRATRRRAPRTLAPRRPRGRPMGATASELRGTRAALMRSLDTPSLAVTVGAQDVQWGPPPTGASAACGQRPKVTRVPASGRGPAEPRLGETRRGWYGPSHVSIGDGHRCRRLEIVCAWRTRFATRRCEAVYVRDGAAAARGHRHA